MKDTAEILLLPSARRLGRNVRDEDPPRVTRVDPAHETAGVFRDAPVLVCLSHALDARSVDTRTVAVVDSAGTIPARVYLSPDRQLVVWRADRLLNPGELHLVIISGLWDEHGQSLPPHSSHFVPCDVTGRDVPE